jgi:hypothetical protein
MISDSPIKPHTSAAYNVLYGWLTGEPVPEQPRQRNKSRAGYRKTTRRRGDVVIGAAPRRSKQLTLV